MSNLLCASFPIARNTIRIFSSIKLQEPLLRLPVYKLVPPNLSQTNLNLALRTVQFSYLAFQWPYYRVISIKGISEHMI